MRNRWFILIAAAVAVLALLATACGGDDDDSAGGENAATATADAGDNGDDSGDETPEATAEDGSDDGSSAGALDACSLITRDEAEATLGESVGEGVKLDTPPVYSCTYETETFTSVSIVAVVFDDSGQAKETYEFAVGTNDYPEIEGIGERAYFALGFGLTAQQGKYEITVDVLGPDDDRALEEELARKALDRLP